MSGVGGVSGSRQQPFNDEELAAMRKDDATSAIVNKARRDAGYREPDVAVRGDDRSLDQVLHERKTHISVGEAVAGAIHGVEVVEAVGVMIPGLHFLKSAPHIALPVLALGAAHYGMYEMERSKAEMKDGATRDQLHAAILDRLDVPSGFRDREMGRLNVSMTAQSASKKISDQFDLGDTALVATLQLHCDQGMNAARDMIESGSSQTKESFLKSRPAVEKRYAEDVAFKNGFDAISWAKTDSPTTYAAAISKLDSRDARYDSAHVTYRM